MQKESPQHHTAQPANPAAGDGGPTQGGDSSASPSSSPSPPVVHAVNGVADGGSSPDTGDGGSGDEGMSSAQLHSLLLYHAFERKIKTKSFQILKTGL